MSASQLRSFAPSLARRDVLLDRVESAAGIAANGDKTRIALDEALQALREETARTMALVRRQRRTPLYRRVARQAAL